MPPAVSAERPIPCFLMSTKDCNTTRAPRSCVTDNNSGTDSQLVGLRSPATLELPARSHNTGNTTLAEYRKHRGGQGRHALCPGGCEHRPGKRPALLEHEEASYLVVGT